MKAMEFCSIKRARKLIKKELKQVELKTASVFGLMRSTAARENCYRKLMAALEAQPVDPSAAPYPPLSASMHDLVRDYLELTVFTMENLLKWRSQLEKLLRRDKMSREHHVRHEVDKLNYLERIVREGQEVCKRLRADREDIFLVGYAILELPKVRGCEIVLVEEAVVQGWAC